MTVPPIVALLLSPAAVVLILLVLRWLARPHDRMYAEISRRCALAHDRTPVLRPSVDGPAAGAGTPDPAPARIHVALGGPARHRKAA